MGSLGNSTERLGQLAVRSTAALVGRRRFAFFLPPDTECDQQFPVHTESIWPSEDPLAIHLPLTGVLILHSTEHGACFCMRPKNKWYKTFSYLPELTGALIGRQVQMAFTNGLLPCLEFSAEESSLVSNDNTVRFPGTAAGYSDDPYWTMWGLSKHL